ncbi:PLP-dependent transferase [Aulographum hederae CBS 113979]|uniref:Molybdenum cofactor sulfurase n=1 Tax=Aulographum hederae CBS 113979 TaxID=1176131 RepID=A0A6G1H3Y9_9PEZI|nr:PLP-dependent transferase [Aulographum hederae CBS 113979]
MDDSKYDQYLEHMRLSEYPMLKGTTYLDHAGTTLYSKSLIDRFSADMIANHYGNPHSASSSSQNTSARIDTVRTSLLDLFHADPDEFDLVFVANATAGIKLVADAFRESEGGFWYGYHKDAHTSLVGVRELAASHRCFESDEDVERWLNDDHRQLESSQNRTGLFGYPAQSNMNGRRLPLHWPGQISSKAQRSGNSLYTLLDAAALVSTAPLKLSNTENAPDFTVLSLYKMFGFPDLGCLIVRKSSGGILRQRKYFGGGTVDMVVCVKEQWHARKSETLHDGFEDGTLPIHSILAVQSALEVHRETLGSLERISRHTTALAKQLLDGLESLQHGNKTSVCTIYSGGSTAYGNASAQGPIVSFNVQNAQGSWIGHTEVEKLASIKDIQLRTGGLCNPGGIASSLDLAPWEMRQNFSAGQRCGTDHDIMNGKPTGMIRVSLGAMSTSSDVRRFLEFVEEYFVEDDVSNTILPTPPPTPCTSRSFQVESLMVYPIKSCAGYRIPTGTPWYIRKEGLVWDREWCLIHRGTGAALSQKRYPKMALLRPAIDFTKGVLRVRYTGSTAGLQVIEVPLSEDPSLFDNADYKNQTARVCGDTITTRLYRSEELNMFFTDALGVDCQLARFPASGTTTSTRHAKAHLQKYQKQQREPHIPGSFPEMELKQGAGPTMLLSNESPILMMSRSSLNRLNEQIKLNGGKAVHAEVFRANIIIAEPYVTPPGDEEPYAEDTWHGMQIGCQYFRMLGSCRRCQMVCVDQDTAVKNEEPFTTLSKTRRFDGKVFFGQHSCHVPLANDLSPQSQNPTITVGDVVRPITSEDEVMEDAGILC